MQSIVFLSDLFGSSFVVYDDFAFRGKGGTACVEMEWIPGETGGTFEVGVQERMDVFPRDRTTGRIVDLHGRSRRGSRRRRRWSRRRSSLGLFGRRFGVGRHGREDRETSVFVGDERG